MDNKNRLKKMAAAAALLALAACAEKVEVNNTEAEQSIGISVNVHQDWENTDPYKAPKKNAHAQRKGIKAEGTVGGEPVYLWDQEMAFIGGKGTSVDIQNNEEDEATRGKLMHGTLGNDAAPEINKFHNTFNIYGEKAPGGRTATWRHDNEWSLSQKFTWADDNTYTFYGIAPANAAGVTEASETGFTYTVPRNALDQTDLMAGPTDKQYKRTDRHMWFDFSHVLSAIKFKLGDFKEGYSITKIELAGIYKTNTYNFATKSWNAFTGTEEKFTPTAPASSTMTTPVLSTAANSMITSDAEGTTFVVLPQEVPTDGIVIITLVPDGTTSEEYISASIHQNNVNETQVWKPGHTYTYTITYSDVDPSTYVLTVEDDPVFAYDGTTKTTNQFKVTSYRDNNGTQEAVAWTIDGYMLQNEDGTWPTEWQSTETTMLSSLSSTNGTGSITGEDITAAVKAQTPTIKRVVRRQDVLRDPERPTRTDFDLSIHKLDNSEEVITRTTANCYIVRYPGTYKFPLVVGNAIQNGVAKGATDFGVTRAEQSVNVSNGPVTGIPWKYGYNVFKIYDGGNGQLLTTSNCIINETDYYLDEMVAEIVWHDFCDPDNGYAPLTVIKDLKIEKEGDFYFMKFTVDENTIQQGNAVLAVKDWEGDEDFPNFAYWSWHIYITDTDWSQKTTITNYSGRTYELAPENLGYVDEVTTTTYPERKMKVRVHQSGSNKLAEVIISQVENKVRGTHHWDTKYQWGRKDAFPGLGDDQKYYTGNITVDYFDYPHVSIGSPSVWGQDNGYGRWYLKADESTTYTDRYAWINLWSASETTVQASSAKVSSTKTIYDPSPVGYKVPPAQVFTGMIKTNNPTEYTWNETDATNKENTNVVGEYDGEGWNFYCNGKSGLSPEDREADGTFFMPSTGQLQYNVDTDKFVLNGHLTGGDLGWQGWVWFCVPRMNQGSSERFSAWNASWHRYRVRTLPNNTQATGIAVRPVAE